jgi:hypothetical protein
VLAHEDDVKIARWREKYDQIPEDTKDPGLMRMKKDLKRKAPKRRENQQYWNEQQFDKLRTAEASKLYSKGPLPWRLLAYMLDASPDVELIRRLVGKRLMDSQRIEAGQRDLDAMLMTLWRAGYVRLEPEPPVQDEASTAGATPTPPKAPKRLIFDLATGRQIEDDASGTGLASATPPYRPEKAHATKQMPKLLLFRGVHPLYAVFLLNQLGIANREERVQAFESVLELPRSIGHFVRVPKQQEMPPGPLAVLRLDEQLLRLGLATEEELRPQPEQEDRGPRHTFDEDRVWVLALADKLRRLFDYDFPNVRDLRTSPVWAAGELLQFGGNFNNYVTSKGLQKQEGLIFRHLLRMILLLAEFTQLCPADVAEADWRGELEDISARIAECCRRVDPTSTEKVLEEAANEAAAEEE